MSGEGRRTFLEKLVWVASGAFGAVASIPLVGAVVDPVVRRGRPGSGRFVRVARLDGLRKGEPRKFTILGDAVDGWIRAPRRKMGAVWLVRGEGEEVAAYSVICPHLGCGIDWRAERRKFDCPCHGSAFGPDGARKDGPSPRDMDRLEARVERGDVLVRWVKYRQGTAERIQVG